MKRFYPLPIVAFLLAVATGHAQQGAAGIDAGSLPSFLQPRAIELTTGSGGSIGAGALPGATILPGADPTLPTRLQAALERALATVDPRARRGVQVSIIAPGLGLWSGTAGLSDTATPIDAAMRFQVGSISKTFVAAAILQLVDEAKLSLDDTIGRWIDAHPNIDGGVTIRQLLNHSSGIFDYLNDDPDHALLIEGYFVDPSKRWTPEEILGYVQAPNFAKGTKTKYSNTNFLLLGMIIEKVTGRSLGDELRARFFVPLGLASTYCGWENNVEGAMAHGWSTGFDAVDSMKQADISSIPTSAALSIAWAAGGIVSTATDLARWSDALYNGRVLSAASTKAMLTFRNTSEGEIGLGAFRYHYYSRILYGHTGGILGYSSWTFAIPRDTVSVGILLNSFHGVLNDGMADIAIALLDELYRPVSGVADERSSAGALALEQSYPNPSSGETTIRYTIPTRSHVTLEIFDAAGARVAMPVNGVLDAGAYLTTVRVDRLPSGTYFYALHAGERTMVRGMQVGR